MSVRLIRWSGRQSSWEDFVQLGPGKSHLHGTISPADAIAGFRIHSDGTMDGREGGGYTIDDGTWLLYGINSDYEVRATLASGDTPSFGTLNTWLACSTTRAWEVSFTGNFGTMQCTLTIELRLASSGQVLDQTTVFLEAIVDI